MAKRASKKAVKPPKTVDPGPRLRQSLDRCTKGELIDVLVELARRDRAVLRRLAARLELQAPPKELVGMTRQAIADATAFDERWVNYNFDYDYEAYKAVERNLRQLVGSGHLRPAMALSVELMDRGSYQVESSDEGLMTEDIEACLSSVLKALHQCDLPAAEVIVWCTKMLKTDRAGFICDQELRALRERLETQRST